MHHFGILYKKYLTIVLFLLHKIFHKDPSGLKDIESVVLYQILLHLKYKPLNNNLMQPNFLALITAALSTLVVGFIWYNPKVFGSIWMKEAGITMEEGKKPNMVKMLGLTVLYGFFVAFILQFLVIHQYGALGMIGGDPTVALPSYEAFLQDYGTNYRTFKHGMLHGFMAGLFFALPVIGMGALYENRSWRYVLICGGYWVVDCMLMGGILCAWQ